jgi:hypothetical protein
MTIAGIDITDTDSLIAAADILDDVETWITCPECDGHKSIIDYSPGLGWINLQCPGCEGYGAILDTDPDDFDPEPPTPAAPAPAVVVPLYRCDTCRDTGRVAKPSAWFAGKVVEGFCPDCTPHFDFASGRFVNCGADATGEATPPAASAPFDRAAHCRRIASYGGVATVTTHGAHHMRVIGQVGARVTIERHGYDYWRGLMDAKGWQAPRQVSFLDDLRAGRMLADLDQAA